MPKPPTEREAINAITAFLNAQPADTPGIDIAKNAATVLSDSVSARRRRAEQDLEVIG